MKTIYFFLLLFITQNINAQLKVTNIDKNDIPKTISYKGHIVNAVKYWDNEGEHLVITTETGKVPTKGEDNFKNADLYAYSYKVEGSSLKLSWQMHDFISDCDVDIVASYIPNTFAVSDLNKDGKAEVWLMYKTICHGDVSPSDMKIIMHEGDKKYAMRGTNKVKVSATEYAGGKYTFDDTFKIGPQLFRDYALQLWKKNLIEKWGE